MNAIDVIKIIIAYCEANAQRESSFLYPNPGYVIDPFALLDHVCEKCGVTQDDVKALPRDASGNLVLS